MGGAADIKGLGGGVHEYRLHSGAGYWVYFGKEGDALVILLVGGSKQRQSTDIDNAKALCATMKAERLEVVRWH